MSNCEAFFKNRIDALRAEGRYRHFADLERRAGDFPRAYHHSTGSNVTVLEQLLRDGSTSGCCEGDA